MPLSKRTSSSVPLLSLRGKGLVDKIISRVSDANRPWKRPPIDLLCTLIVTIKAFFQHVKRLVSRCITECGTKPFLQIAKCSILI